jgi:hypothetical protein
MMNNRKKTEEDSLMRLPTLAKAAGLSMASVIVLGCGFFGTTVPQAGEAPGAVLPSPETASPSAGEGAGEVLEDLTDPRVEATLALRSVNMVLEADFPGGVPIRILVSIDAAGNQRIETTTPVPEESTLTPESPEWNVFEIFIVDGEAFARMGKAGSAEPDPEENNALSEILYNPMGPGMWLILLPEESFTRAGKESKGGFDAVKYTMDGSLDGDPVTGEFWLDEPTGALIGADLSLAENILSPVESGTGGTVTIDFSVEKADVPAIAVPQ